MRPLFLVFIAAFLGSFAYAQLDSASTSYRFQPHFVPGMVATYHVKEESRAPEFVKGAWAKNEFKVDFKVIDTIGGFKFHYTVETLSSNHKNWIVASMAARISHGLQLYYTIGPTGLVTRFYNLNKVREQLIHNLDSIIQENTWNRQDSILLSHFRMALQKPTGPEICLGPMKIFNNLFHLPPFRKQKDYIAAVQCDLFNQAVLPGVMIQQLKSVENARGSVKLGSDFIGNRDSAAKYEAPLFQEIYNSIARRPINASYLPTQMRNDSERTYFINRNEGWPERISSKGIEFYMQRITTKIDMQLKIE